MPSSDPATSSIQDGWSPEFPTLTPRPCLALSLLNLGGGNRPEGAHFYNSVITIIALITTQSGALWGLRPLHSALTPVHLSSSTWGHRCTAQGTALGHPTQPNPAMAEHWELRQHQPHI